MRSPVLSTPERLTSPEFDKELEDSRKRHPGDPIILVGGVTLTGNPCPQPSMTSQTSSRSIFNPIGVTHGWISSS